ncbi:Hypothetical predicted protein [Pelobates cultripes]|uniref:Uncharacterized protein n=1 Tax=Pelobates cultripes TaxID=61616 RepID=A0AAD1RZ51_PELCU|nr:Hypothetical predicted protein [Pelobates cultripes]
MCSRRSHGPLPPATLIMPLQPPPPQLTPPQPPSFMLSVSESMKVSMPPDWLGGSPVRRHHYDAAIPPPHTRV